MPFAPTLPFSFMTKEETEAFFSVIPREKIRDRLLFDVIYRHSLRRGEATLVRLDHIKRGRTRWEIGITRLKRGESRCYPVFPSTKRYLLMFLRNAGRMTIRIGSPAGSVRASRFPAPRSTLFTAATEKRPDYRATSAKVLLVKRSLGPDW